MSLRILLVDDSASFLEALRQLLASVPGIAVVGEARDGRQGLEMAAKLQPDLVLLDISMPVLNGMDAARALRVWPKAPHIVLLSLQVGAEYSAAAKDIGALGFVSKSDLVTGLLPLIERLVLGLPALPECSHAE